MMDHIIVACGGNGTRWTKSTQGMNLPADKCRLRVNGEALMDRIASGLSGRIRESLSFVVTMEVEYKLAAPAAISVPLQVTSSDVDKFLSSQRNWSSDGRTIVAFGDVWMTDKCMDVIAHNGVTGISWYGRRKASKLTGKPYGEIWAVSFDSKSAKRFEDACLSTALQLKLGQRRRAIGWDVFEVLTGKPACAQDNSFWDIDDMTEDFDTAEDWHKWYAAAVEQRIIDRTSR